MDRRRVVAAAMLAVSLSLVVGCAATYTIGEEAAPSVSELPDWVRVVVPERDGKSLFVGGASFAKDPESGIEAAEADARSQVYLHATRFFTEHFNRGVAKSGVDTEPIERLDLKNAISSDFGRRMSDMAVREDAYHRPCGDDTKRQSDDGDNAGPVCQIFVLVSVDEGEWKSVLVEMLEAEKERRHEDEQQNLSSMAEWLIRDILGEEQTEDRENTR